MVVGYFKKNFTTSHFLHPFLTSPSSPIYPSSLSMACLGSSRSSDEFYSCLAQMPSSKCLGPDGIQPIFYKQIWADLGSKITDFISQVFSSGVIPPHINKTYLSLVLKVHHPTHIKDCRLCNTIYKLITKIVAMRTSKAFHALPYQSPPKKFCARSLY